MQFGADRGITEQRASSSKVNADGIGSTGAIADCRGLRGLESGARDVGKCFKRLEVIRIILPFGTCLCLGVFRASG
jgi:hypothetical protein